jgi:hypothetical protein
MGDMRMQDPNLQGNFLQSLIQTVVRGVSGMTHPAPTGLHRLRSRHHRAAHQHQDLHCIKPDYINPNINVKLYDYIKLRQDHRRVLHRQQKHRQGLHQHGLSPPPTKNLAVAVIFDRRRLGHDPPLP